MSRPNILFLADTTHQAQAVTDHIQAVTTSRVLDFHVLNPLVCKTIDKLDFGLFDAIGLHYSIKPDNYYYLSLMLQKKIAAYSGVKFLFLQDEYQKVNKTQDYIHRLGFDILFTLVNEALFDIAYPDPRLKSLKKVQVLTGYVQDEMKFIDAPPVSDRPIDVSYRSRRCDYWLGSLAHEKEQIARDFVHYASDADLTLDISVEESSRIYGAGWLNLLMQSKAVLGTESGASLWDFDESIAKKTKQFLRRHKKSSFEEVFEHVLKPHDGVILYNAISPRVFEAAATRTPMIMYPGYYNGICQPDVHYIKLEKDFSNVSDVIKKIKDIPYLQSVADRAYIDLIESDLYSQHRFSTLVSDVILSTIKNVQPTPIELTSSLERVMQSHRLINRCRCLFTETRFIIHNFLNLLLEPQDTLFDKMKRLKEGLKRYIAYVVPRLKKSG